MGAKPSPLTLAHPTVHATFVIVTPDLAKAWLAKNTRNRILRRTDVDRYKRDMAAGNWREDGSPLRFAVDGTLLDGQHRLAALAEAGVSLPLLVVRGVQTAAQDVMDTGRRRTAGDALAINGKANSNALAAAARLAIEYEYEEVDSKHFDVSHAEVLDYINDNPDLESAVSYTQPLARRADVAPAVAAVSYFLMRRLSPQDAAEFWNGLATKAGLRQGDPLLALAARLAELRRSKSRMPRRVVLSMVFRTWNARRAGQQATRIQTQKGGAYIPIPELH